MKTGKANSKLDEVKVLIARAQDPRTPVNEAASAALLAVRIMGERSMVVTFAAHIASLTAKHVLARAGMIDAEMDYPRTLRREPPGPSVRTCAVGKTWKVMAAAQDCSCGLCGLNVKRGERVWHTPGQWVRCDALECIPGGL